MDRLMVISFCQHAELGIIETDGKLVAVLNSPCHLQLLAADASHSKFCFFSPGLFLRRWTWYAGTETLYVVRIM
jgi:hypothetical protein